MDTHRRAARPLAAILAALLALTLPFAAPAPVLAQPPAMDLESLVALALRDNPELAAAQARVSAARHRIPQAKALPDPMVSAGYTNDGLASYTFGKSYDAQWAFGLSQTIPFPGKLIQKGKVAEKDMEALGLQLHALRLGLTARVKELAHELFLAHRSLEILAERAVVLEQAEKAALARLATGLGMQSEAMMAQTEKFMLAERREMVRQRLSTLEGMLNAALGREARSPLGKPGEPSRTPYGKSLEDLLAKASFDSPEIKTRAKRVERAEAKVGLAKAEFVPDLTLSAGYAQKGYRANQDPLVVTGAGGEMGADIEGSPGFRQRWVDMWSAGVSVTVPLYFFVKQAEGLKESRSELSETRWELENAKNMVASAIRENHAMLTSAERLMALFSTGTIPKARRDFQTALANYAGGKGDLSQVVSLLRAVLDYEVQYWAQVVEKNKAQARLEALAGFSDGLTQPGAAPEALRDGQHKAAHSGQGVAPAKASASVPDAAPPAREPAQVKVTPHFQSPQSAGAGEAPSASRKSAQAVRTETVSNQ